jgi:uncharacterized membrane protein (DUF106 family)
MFNLPVPILEIFASAAITLVITIIYKFLANQNEMKQLKVSMKEKQSKIKELQKTNPQEANKMLNEVMALSSKQMRMNMKPMLLTLVVVSITLPWLGQTFPGAVVKLPFTLPYFENDLGWLAWYIIVSIPLGYYFRKLLRVEL